jgi:hypothetical protein
LKKSLQKKVAQKSQAAEVIKPAAPAARLTAVAVQQPDRMLAGKPAENSFGIILAVIDNKTVFHLA